VAAALVGIAGVWTALAAPPPHHLTNRLGASSTLGVTSRLGASSTLGVTSRLGVSSPLGIARPLGITRPLGVTIRAASQPHRSAASARRHGAAGLARALALAGADLAGRRPGSQFAPTASLDVSRAARQHGTPQQIARAMLGAFGWGGGQFRYLDWLWERESGWNVRAANPYSGAYGIPQADPGDTMASAGPNWQTSARTQIRWGLTYIRDRYGSPRAAWGHEVSTGWY
jgi:hypothetical protein